MTLLPQTAYQVIKDVYWLLINANPFSHMGYLGLFLNSLIPSIIIVFPDQSVLIPVWQANQTFQNILIMFLVYSTALVISKTMIFFLAHHLTNLVKKEKKRATFSNHILFKYKLPIFILVPSLIYGIGDIILIYAGTRHLHYKKIFPYLVIGAMIRASWGIALAIYISNLLTLS